MSGCVLSAQLSKQRAHRRKYLPSLVMQLHRVRLLRSHYEGMRIEREGETWRERDFLYFLSGACEPYVQPWDTGEAQRGPRDTPTHGKQAADCVQGEGGTDTWKKGTITSKLSSIRSQMKLN